MLDYDALFGGGLDVNALDAFAPPPTPKPQARANALRTKPTRTSTSVSPTVGSQEPVTMNAAQTRSHLGQQALGDIESAQAEIDKYTGPQDYTAMQDYAKQRTKQGQHSLLLALAAQTAGQEFAPIGGAYLKQAMEARTPLKTATGIIDDMGQHIEDPQAKAEQRIKLAQARMAKAQQVLQSNATAEEKAAAQAESNALRREIAAGNNALRQMTAGLAQQNAAGVAQGRVMNQANQLRDDFAKATEKPREALRAAQQVTSLVPDLQKMNAQQQQATVFAFMRMLDPGSVVRESEYALAEKGKGLLDMVANYPTQLASGKKLTPQQVLNMQELSHEIIKQQQRLIDEAQTNYASVATQAGIPVNYVLPGYRPAGGGAADAGPAPGAVRVKGAPAPSAAPASPDAPPPGAVRVKR